MGLTSYPTSSTLQQNNGDDHHCSLAESLVGRVFPANHLNGFHVGMGVGNSSSDMRMVHHRNAAAPLRSSYSPTSPRVHGFDGADDYVVPDDGSLKSQVFFML